MSFSGPFKPMALRPIIECVRNPEKPNVLIGVIGFTVPCHVTGFTRDSVDSRLKFAIGYPRKVKTGKLHDIWIHVTSEGLCPDEVEFELYPEGVNLSARAGTLIRVPVRMIQCRPSSSTTAKTTRRSGRRAGSGSTPRTRQPSVDL